MHILLQNTPSKLVRNQYKSCSVIVVAQSRHPSELAQLLLNACSNIDLDKIWSYLCTAGIPQVVGSVADDDCRIHLRHCNVLGAHAFIIQLLTKYTARCLRTTTTQSTSNTFHT